MPYCSRILPFEVGDSGAVPESSSSPKRRAISASGPLKATRRHGLGGISAASCRTAKAEQRNRLIWGVSVSLQSDDPEPSETCGVKGVGAPSWGPPLGVPNWCTAQLFYARARCKSTIVLRVPSDPDSGV
jgi:hypothetical protein